jgi:glutathione S-transferase
MIVVHHLNNSRSQRVLWLLEELGVPYEIKPYKRNSQTMLAPPELRAVHPLGKSPVITDGDITVAETGAIVEYLIETYGDGKLIPKAGTAEKRDYTYWLHYAEGSAMPPFLLRLVFLRLPVNAPALIKLIVKGVAKTALSRFIDPQIANQLTWWETTLAATPWWLAPGSAWTAGPRSRPS